MPTANYAVTASVNEDSGSFCFIKDKTTTGFKVGIQNYQGANVQKDFGFNVNATNATLPSTITQEEADLIIDAIENGTGRMVLETAQASTSGTSIDFTSIPSWVKQITVMFQGVSMNGTAEPLIQIGTSGGIQSSAYLGASTFLAVGSMGARPYSTAPASSAGFAWFNYVGASKLMNGSVTLSLLSASNGTWTLNGMLGDSGTTDMYISAGSKTLSGTLDRVRITTTNGTDTFAAGSINLLLEG